MRIFRAEMGVGNRWGMVSLGRRFDAVDAGLLDIYWIFTGYLLGNGMIGCDCCLVYLNLW
jgi:hypothetical protein